MARELIEGFASQNIKLWDGASSGSPTVSNSDSALEGYYCELGDWGTRYITRSLSSAQEKYVGYRIKPFGSSSRAAVVFMNGSTDAICINRNATTKVMEVFRGTWNSTLIATGTILVPDSAIVWIEIYVKADPTNGVVQVKVNGVLDINFSGNSCAYTTLDGFRLGCNYPTYQNARYAHIKIDGANWTGFNKIQGTVINADGDTIELTPSAGSNYQCVDDNSESDYIYENTVNKRDDFAKAALTGDIYAIKCAQIQATAMEQGSATPQNLQLLIRKSSTDYVSSDKAVPSSASQALFAIWEQDPTTSALWTESGFNAANIGAKLVT